MRWWLSFFVCVGCSTELLERTRGELRLEPEEPIQFSGFQGARLRATVLATNQGSAAMALQVGTEGPFSVTNPSRTVGPGETVALEVEAESASVGQFAGALLTNGERLPLELQVLPPLSCPAKDGCTVARFDPDRQGCVTQAVPDGSRCGSRCFDGPGTCQRGVCIGSVAVCDDGDPCTTDACGHDGCLHGPVVCPLPEDPCLASRCGEGGCEQAPVEDGVPCGEGLGCNEQGEVHVCLAGRCVLRAVPDACGPRWIQRVLVGRDGAASAYDPVQRRTLLVGGTTGVGQVAGDETFSYDGTGWAVHDVAVRPPPRVGAAMASDLDRSTVLLFGGREGPGGALLGDTWLWNGKRWSQVDPRLPGPSPRSGHAMAFDERRRRVILFGGETSRTPAADDSWEWDGARWSRLAGQSPPGRRLAAMAFDPGSERLVLHGGVHGEGGTEATWALDEDGWRRLLGMTPRAREGRLFLRDGALGRLLLLGGPELPLALDTGWLWAFNGGWTRVESSGPVWLRDAVSVSTPDPTRGSTLVMGSRGDPGVWLRRAGEWSRTPCAHPFALVHPRCATDGARGEVLCAAGLVLGPNNVNVRDVVTPLWRWDATARRLTSTLVPAPAERDWNLATTGQGLLMVGQPVGSFVEPGPPRTWTWDGRTWTRQEGSFPLAPEWPMAWDALRGRVVAASDAVTAEWTTEGWVTQATPELSGAVPSRTAAAWLPPLGRVLRVQPEGTFAWDGARWERLGDGPRPGGCPGVALAFDARRAELVLLCPAMAPEKSAVFRWRSPGWEESREPLPWGHTASALAADERTGRLVVVNGQGVWELSSGVR